MSTTTPTQTTIKLVGEPADIAALAQKLKEVAESIAYVDKRGQHGQGYSFAQAIDVVRDVRTPLFARNVIVLSGIVPGSLAQFTETGGKGFVTTADFAYLFIDCGTGAAIEVPWAGAGNDFGGDKGLYKAMTGALKYQLLDSFLLPTTDDPEHDALSQQHSAPAAGQDRSKDADRPAATAIPRDRGEAILALAVRAGVATHVPGEPPVFFPPFKAKLAEVGVQRIGQLDVDRAEDVEQWLASELEEAERAAAENESEARS